MKVKAAVARVHGAPLSLQGLELDEPRPEEILVRLVASGVTRADLAAIDGRLAIPLPFVPGCEGAGIVERVGDAVSGIEAGDAVVVGFASCGHCPACLAGDDAFCDAFGDLNLSGRRSDGSTSFVPEADGTQVLGCFFGQSSFATHLLCRGRNAFKVDDEAPLELLAGLGQDVLRGAGVVLRCFDLQRGDKLVIFGADAAGLAALMTAQSRGAGMIVVIDASEARRVRAEALGATATVHDVVNAGDIVRSLAGDGADYAFDTSGEHEAREACRDCISETGLCAFSNAAGEAAVTLTAKDGTARHAKVRVDRETMIEDLVAMRAHGTLPLEEIIAFFPFEHVNDAIAALRSDAVAKPALRFSLGSFGELDRALQEGAANDAPVHEDEPEGVHDPDATRDDLVNS